MGKKAGVTYSRPDKLGSYLDALRLAGIEPVPISPVDSRSLDGLDGLLVSGGVDVNPALYDQAPHDKTDQPESSRDQMEIRLIEQALDRDLPFLGICRGLQLLNVMHGGTLIQHLPDPNGHKVKPLDAHAIAVEPGTRLAEIIGPGEHVVNSRHHQAADRLGDGLRVSARAPDGVIEGLERPDKRFAIAVQWHPEDRCHIDPLARRLFEAFAEALDPILK
jgi:gamma-glutamyl-gamma-aminobutyrate hydrolase PuuD